MEKIMQELQTIKEHKEVEIEEKRSKFIANIFYVESAQDAMNKIKEIRKKYYDAKHHCYAYVIQEENLIKKASDDGEPSGTAGSPILNAIEKNELRNVLIVVTRYFRRHFIRNRRTYKGIYRSSNKCN